ncbi:MAG: thioredoxin family protein [Coriobacteriia bacterium]|nr:thioredoxin family protein [Coriobacteriia bacterium]
MEVKLFIKEDCPRCPAAKRAVEGLQNVSVYNVDSIDGFAEAAFHGILATPSVLVIDSSGHEIAAWRGEAPDLAALHTILAN